MPTTHGGTGGGGTVHGASSGGTTHGTGKKKKKKGGGGFKLPSLGVDTLLKTLAAIPTGIVRAGAALAPGGTPAGEPVSRIARGIGSSVEGLGFTAAEILTLGKAPNPTASAFGASSPTPRSFFKQAGDEGILPALFETIGTASLVGGGVSKLAKAGSTGRVANAAVTAERAGRANTLAGGSRAAVRASDQATKAAARALDVAAPASAVARRSGVIRGANAVANPYRTLLSEAVRPVGRAAQAKMAGSAPGGGVVDDVRVATPKGTTIFGRNIGPATKAAQNLPDMETPSWATKAVEGKLAPLTRPLAAIESKMQGSAMKRGVYAEARRSAEASRRATMSSPAVKASVEAAKALRGQLDDSGAKITTQMADDMIGAAMHSRLSLVGDVADDFGVRPALEATGDIKSPIPARLLTPELTAKLDEAEAGWRTLDAERSAAMGDSRLGMKGITDEVAQSRGQAKRFKSAAADMRAAERLRGERVPAAVRRASDRYIRLDAQVTNLRNQLANIEKREASIAGRQSTPVANLKRSAYLERTLRRAEATRTRIEETTKIRDDIVRILSESRLPAQLQAAMLDGRATRSLEKLAKELDNPSVSAGPGPWKPLIGAVENLRRAAEDSPALAAQLKDVPQSLSAMLRYAAERGFDPIHMSSLSNAEVHRMVFGAVALGRKGVQLGKEMEGGFRKTRRSASARTQSIEALIAGHYQVAHELNTNAIVDTMEKMTYAIPESGIPAGFVEWDSLRSFVHSGERPVDGFVTPAKGATRMIPRSVAKSLDAYSKDITNPALLVLGKITNPWRFLVLTLSPRWYINNFMGNAVMASVEGVRLQDWRKAWQEYKTGFENVPAVTGASLVSELGATSMLPRGTVREAAKMGRIDNGIRGAVSEGFQAGAGKMQRWNEVVDEISRAAVFEKGVRTGLSPEAALNRAFTALVDYHDMTPWERGIVRSVVPFYSFQKGTLKIVARLPIDHPKAMAVMAEFGRLNQEMVEEDGLPELYSSVIGGVNLRALNPFQDSANLTTPRGIAGAMNPFLELPIRNAMGAPEGGFADQFRINEFGGTEPDTSPAQGFLDILTNIPQARTLRGVTGDEPEGSTGLRELGKFFGAATYTPEQLEAIRERLKKSKERIAKR